MNTNNSLSFMQTLATFSLISSLGFAYLINPIDDSLLFQATSSITESIYLTSRELTGETWQSKI